MNSELLALLRCPFCGTPLSLVENPALLRDATRIESGVLGCQCCAFPIVAGIPILIANDTTRAALHALERDAGKSDDALCLLLGLHAGDDAASGVQDARASEFLDLLTHPGPTTYSETLAILCPDGDAEGDYLRHRFSDPSYRLAEAILLSLGQARWPLRGPVLDLCGGAGHLTRVVTSAMQTTDATPSPPPIGGSSVRTVTADIFFWKLWLATNFVAPGAQVICCDANHPLPFAPDTFSTVVLADAFPYIWHKRLLAEEMMRLVGATGAIVMPHLHNALGDNFSAGDTLSPDAYRALYAKHKPRLYSDTALFSQVLKENIVDLSHAATTPEDLDREPSVTLVASPRDDLFSRYTLPTDPPVAGTLTINPLYQLTREGRGTRLTLTFPTPEYAVEFADCRQYLPDTVSVDADLTTLTEDDLNTQLQHDKYQDLRRRRVILDAPSRYCGR